MTKQNLVPSTIRRHNIPTAFEPLFQRSVGMDSMLERLFDDFLPTTKTTTFPPYNIRVGVDGTRVIELAVAGYTEKDLDVMVEGDGILVIRGGHQTTTGENSHEDISSEYLYRGIATRRFESKFKLAEGAEVTGAELNNGMLTVTVKVSTPKAEEPIRIPIGIPDS